MGSTVGTVRRRMMAMDTNRAVLEVTDAGYDAADSRVQTIGHREKRCSRVKTQVEV